MILHGHQNNTAEDWSFKLGSKSSSHVWKVRGTGMSRSATRMFFQDTRFEIPGSRRVYRALKNTKNYNFTDMWNGIQNNLSCFKKLLSFYIFYE